MGGWKTLKVLITGGGGGGGEEVGVLKGGGGGGGGWLLNFFFPSFSNHDSYNIKNIRVCSKSKIKAKVSTKQNLELLLRSFRAIFIRELVFLSSPRANFPSFEYLCFSCLLVCRFILI